MVIKLELTEDEGAVVFASLMFSAEMLREDGDPGGNVPEIVAMGEKVLRAKLEAQAEVMQ